MFFGLKNLMKYGSIFFGFSLLVSNCKPYYNAFYTDPVKCFAKACENEPYDVIIVPGFPSDSGRINPILAERINWAFFLYKNNYTKNIIFSGAAVYSPFVEAKIMRLYALQLGIRPEHIFVETKAKHTTENLYYSCVMAEELGFKKIAFATQPAQTSFMKPFRRKFGLKLDMLPVLTDSIKKTSFNYQLIDLSEAFVPDFVSIEKTEGLLKRLRGTRGRTVKKEMRKTKRLKRNKNPI